VPPLSPLLDVQALDLESDQLIERHRTLPERTELERASRRIATLDGTHAVQVERREALSSAEDALGAEVTEVAAKAKEVEEVLYSGSVKVPKELEALQEEIRLIRVRQSGLEEKEMALLEEIEQTDGEMDANRAEKAEQSDLCTSFEATIRAAEEEIDGELTVLSGKRAEMAARVPGPILAAYERLRENERLAGRGAARLIDGSCGGCHVKLPVLEYNRMKAEPPDALVFCVYCGRVMVR
jgi:predicted  nucleic acid-binding Zn-ribbon protein